MSYYGYATSETEFYYPRRFEVYAPKCFKLGTLQKRAKEIGLRVKKDEGFYKLETETGDIMKRNASLQEIHDILEREYAALGMEFYKKIVY